MWVLEIEPGSFGIWKSTSSLLTAELSLQTPHPAFFKTGFHISWALSMYRDDLELYPSPSYSRVLGLITPVILSRKTIQGFDVYRAISSSLKTFFKVNFKHCWALNMFYCWSLEI